jgi:hypothetical protein
MQMQAPIHQLPTRVADIVASTAPTMATLCISPHYASANLTSSPSVLSFLTPHHASTSTQIHSHISMSSHLDKNDLLHHFFPLSLPHPQLSACSVNLLTPWSPLWPHTLPSQTCQHPFSFHCIHSIILCAVIIPILSIRWMLRPMTNLHCSPTSSPLPPTSHIADPSASNCLLHIHHSCHPVYTYD